jgi:DNA-binding SARP family transcriptional activator
MGVRMSYPLKVYTLGGLTIQRDHTPMTGFISRKVEALFVYLLCERREHPREVLAEFFWDDLPQARSLANLRMALSSLQQQLAPYLIATRQTLAINPEQTVWLDVSELDAALDSAEQIWARSGRLPRSGVLKLEETLKLYRGDFLAGFHIRDSRGFEDWKLIEQERLRGRMIAALDRIVQQHLERGEYGEGIEHVNRLLQLDPLREKAHRQMMRLQVGVGHRSAAAAQYETCRRILQAELQVEPDAETTALYQQIMQGVVEVVPQRAQVRHNLPLSATPFIERPTEQMQIAARLDDPACRLLTLVGAGGTGKTRLALNAALARVEDHADGVYVISLAPVEDPQYIASTIAATLKVKTGAEPLNDLVEFLRDKYTLLVLDNFEHLIEGTSIVDQILRGTKWLKCVVTSRERLNLHEEWLLPIGGLEFPAAAGNGHDIEQYGAVKLFVQSAQRVQVSFCAGGQRARGQPHLPSGGGDAVGRGAGCVLDARDVVRPDRGADRARSGVFGDRRAQRAGASPQHPGAVRALSRDVDA